MSTASIPAEEYLERVARIQDSLRQKNLDGLLVYSWRRGQVKYLTGYDPNYIANAAVIFIPKQGSHKLMIRFPFDLERANRMTGLQDILASGNMENLARDAAREIMAHQKDTRRIGLVGGDGSMDEIPFSFVQSLREQLPDTIFSDERAILTALRLKKSRAEFEALRKSARVADLGLQTAREVIRAGMTELQLIAAVEHTLRENGAEHHLAVIAAPGSRKLIAPPQERVMGSEEDVIVEIAVEVGGYWTQVAGVLFTTKPTAEQKKIADTIYQAYLHTAGLLFPGKSCAEIARDARDYLIWRGYDGYIEQDFGHGIGLDLPEPPKLEEGDRTVLEPGMVMVVHPAVRVPGVGGAFIGGTVLVDEDGPHCLHDLSALFQEE